MIITNRSKNLQVFKFGDKSIVLEIGENNLSNEDFNLLKTHHMFEAICKVSILQVKEDNVVQKFENIPQKEIIEEERKEESVQIKIKKQK